MILSVGMKQTWNSCSAVAGRGAGFQTQQLEAGAIAFSLSLVRAVQLPLGGRSGGGAVGCDRARKRG
jgi:hypothetical protein